MSARPEPDRSASLPLSLPGERQADEMATAWRRGTCHPAEYYLDRNPELWESSEGGVRLVYEEICLRLERGEVVQPEELSRRFPSWEAELAVLLDCHRLVQSRLTPPQFPVVGEILGDFSLQKELGRGSHGVVFLASQPTLADRHVVLKITPRQDREFLSLARLQHTHIIPLLAAHDYPAQNLRAISLPFLGGTTLARLFEDLQMVSPSLRTGALLVESLEKIGEPLPYPTTGGPRQALAKRDYSDAICWIGACLADALQHAHERGLVHLDLKPSNVLLGADGQPMLLDFHLALQPIFAGHLAPDGLGGTPLFMSPEQRQAFNAAQSGRPVSLPVDGRSDIYSLGRVLYIALGGDGIGEGDSLRRLDRCNSRVSCGLADIIHRCLANDASRRYSSAGALALDLRRHLANLPLKEVPNRSLSERWRKWRRRQPRALMWIIVLLALAAAPLLLVSLALEHTRNAREALLDGRDQLRRRAYHDAVRTIAQGLDQVAYLPGNRNLVGDLNASLQQARLGIASERLHLICERLRLMVGLDTLPRKELLAMEVHCRKVWEDRRQIAELLTTSQDSPELVQQVRVDLLDLVLLWIDLKKRMNPGNEELRLGAEELLKEAETLVGPSVTLAQERRLLHGKFPIEEKGKPRTALEQMMLGRSLLQAGKMDEAENALELALDRNPQNLWAHFYRGVCAHRQSRYDDAVAAFTVVIALAPQFAEIYHNRGLAHVAAGRDVAARRDYDKALSLAPTLAVASLNRGVLNYRTGRFDEAVADLKRAERDGAPLAMVHYNLALVYFAKGDRAKARDHVRRSLELAPNNHQALQLRDRLEK